MPSRNIKPVNGASETQPLNRKVANFRIRALSTLVLAPLVLWIVWFGYPLNLLMAVILAAGIFYEWVRLSRHHTGWLLGGFVYLILGILGLSVHLLHAHPYFFLGLLLTVWTTDISAYLIGSSLGGPKLAPALSPHKTWSGSLGGFVFGTLVGSFIFSFLYAPRQIFSYENIHPVTVLITAIFVVLAQGGDLVESWAKRCLGVKDSGNLIPGHGGLLDRLDSLIAIGFFLFFAEICSEHSLLLGKLSSGFEIWSLILKNG